MDSQRICFPCGHIIRRCNIHDCGQTGIVGHLGGVFSIIEDNHIHHINNMMELGGAEIAGMLGKKESTVRSMLHRGKKILLKALGGEPYAETGR